MNIHLFVIFGKEAAGSPLVVAMERLGVDVTVFSDAVRLNYPQAALRYLVGLPRLLKFAFSAAVRSLRSVPASDATIVNSHFDLMAFALVAKVMRRRRPKIILPGFIFTETKNPLVARIKLFYYCRILHYADIVICHSRNEVDANKKRFPPIQNRFVYFPYAVHVSGAKEFLAADEGANLVVSAGRSGRDYGLLIEAVRGLNADVHIVCDQFPLELKRDLPRNVHILEDCYHDCYFYQLAKCRFVVIPLAVDDISAGQMVLLQAFALGKPVVLSRTATTIDYVQDGEGVLLVEPKSCQSLRHAIKRLSADRNLQETLGHRAAQVYFEKFSIDAYASNLVQAARMAMSSL